uniref:V-set and transmembrane domain-containing protein 2-like protein n=1 Tax=Mola mola TaxID=94237 RepID=A0A3Q3X397_MOLML
MLQAVFTEVPHDMTAQRGQDVEMACSFRGAGTPSYSLEIQWWYIRNHLDWMDRQPWTTNEVAPEEEMPKDATKISVVKVVGSNISHKLRLSRVKPSDEGTYECRVIDFSDDAGARHHRVRAYLQVVPQSDVDDSKHSENFEALDDTKRAHPCRQGVLCSVCFILPPSHIQLIRRHEKFQFVSSLYRTEPQNFFGIFMSFSILELIFLVLLD